jgi:HJR/Mrr/RecB family endonuclease
LDQDLLKVNNLVFDQLKFFELIVELMEKIFQIFPMLNHEVFSYQNLFVDEYNLLQIECLMTNRSHHEEHDVHTNNRLNKKKRVLNLF